MRLFAASLATETNTFSPIPTSLRNFEEAFRVRPGEHPEDAKLCTAPLVVARNRAAQEGFELVEGSCSWAEPSGTLNAADYKTMRDEILAQLKAAMPVDGVLLGLHGAMVAYGYDDCEGDLLEHVRAIVGDACVIGVELDPHCHLTEKRVSLADVIVLFKEYPHIDFMPRAEELVTLVLRTIRGEIRPRPSLYDCRTIAFFPTTREPTKAFVAKMKALEGEGPVLSVSLGHGFPHADVPDMGTRVLVYTDDAKPQGDALAERLGREVIAMREAVSPKVFTIEEAFEEAATTAGEGPVIVAEPSDNAGGGATSDNTISLHALLATKGLTAAVGPIWDAGAVRFAEAAGVGATLDMRIGGKASAASGTPVDARVTVTGLAKDVFQSFGDASAPVGNVAALTIETQGGSVTAVVNSHRTQALGREVFERVGVDLGALDIVVVKSAQHFHAAYAPLARGVLYAETAGCSTQDYPSHPYSRVERPLWPLDDVTDGRRVI
ncbi:MAG: M81 family metallopeptidase [Devosia sp.]